ncbi:polymorphic toxin-type HINT domain-containing protein [Nostoc sp.]|uniref:polymorphic toxin-type HINT domain-containing protein n=1 Tax=Nostoc sp. TaxID=1180 RepID=UPI002FF80F9E
MHYYFATRSRLQDFRSSLVSFATLGNCFVAGTKILTTEGEKNIEDIQVGDWVVSDDPNTPGEIEAHQVLDTFVRQTSALVDLYVDGEVISTTGEHPFWTPDKGWVEAKDLEVGSLLQTEDGRIIDVDKIEKREGQFQVYNFRVEGFHTYFVSDLDILVHNASCAKNARELRKNMENAGVTFNTGEAAHHIVPSTDGRTPAAIAARYTLNSFGIDVNDANNGVNIPIRQHNGQGLHKGSTYKAIDLELRRATSKAEAEGILQDIAAKIKAGTFPPSP